MKTRLAVLFGLLAVAVLIGSLTYTNAQSTQPIAGEFRGLSPAQVAGLQRRLDSTIRERGVLEPVEQAEVSSSVEEPTAILRLVEEGMRVRKGELLVELDDAALRDKLLKQQTVADRARSELHRAELTAVAAKEKNAAGLLAAELAVQVAEIDRKRQEAETALELQITEGEIAVAAQELKLAQDLLDRLKKAAENGVADARALAQAELPVAKARAKLTAAEATKQFLAGHLRTHRSAAADLAIFETKSILAGLRSESAVSAEKARVEIARGKAQVELETAALAEIERQLEGCRIHAPQDGLVVYARGSTRTAVAIEPGAVVRRGQPILILPDMSRLQLRVLVNESRVTRVRVGQSVEIRFDAVPDQTFRGRVASIAEYPAPTTWINADVKEYPVLVLLDDAGPALRPGFTAEASINVAGPDAPGEDAPGE